MNIDKIKNPFRPGAGHMPPYLAGREEEEKEFRKLLNQDTILQNLILTGLRGVGKTVLLETLKPIAIQQKWLWVGTDLSESASVSEENLAIRLLTDLSVVTSMITLNVNEFKKAGYVSETITQTQTLNYSKLIEIYNSTPGLVSDKLKRVLEITWQLMPKDDKRGIIFAYDEAQNLTDHAAKEQYPLSLLLDVFQSIQRKGIPYMLLFTGLPTLFPNLVETRTYSERMFHVLFLRQLSKEASKEAILKPVQEEKDCPVGFDEETVNGIVKLSGGYPYFIQFICKEVFDAWLQRLNEGKDAEVPVQEIIHKLDSDFYAGRWARVTDRQRELLWVIAKLPTADAEFTVQEIVKKSKEILDKPFSSSHINQMLSSLTKSGLVYKNRFGKYLFAVPMLGEFILRQEKEESVTEEPIINDDELG